MNPQQLAAELTSARQNVDRAVAGFNQANRTYEQTMQRYDENWKRTLQPQAYQEQIAQHEAPVEAAETAANEAFDAAHDAIQRVNRLAAMDDGLSDTDRKAAESRSFFVRESVLDLPVSQLWPHLEHAVAGDDKVEKWLYKRYLAAKIEGMGEKLKPEERRRDDTYRRLVEAHDALEQQLTNGTAKRLQEQGEQLRAYIKEQRQPFRARNVERMKVVLSGVGSYGNY